MSDQDIFQQENKVQEVQETNPAPQVNPLEDLLGSIKREDGTNKYSSVEDALKAIPHANSHISSLESENKRKSEELNAIREELAKYKGAAEALDRIAPKEQEASQPAPQLEPEALEGMFESYLTKKQQQELAASNGKQVASALTEKFGEKAQEVFEQAAQENGLSSEDLQQLARKSPQAVLKLFGETSAPKAVPTRSSINSEALPTSSSQEAPPPFSNVGSTAKQAAEHMRWHMEQVYKKHGITK
jgi:hypothetical protein